jgi:hypothetical protein
MQPKRLIIAVLVVILTLGAVVMNVAAAQAPFAITVDTNSATVVTNDSVIVNAGDKIEVELSIESNPNAAYFYFYLDFDAEAFTIDRDENDKIIYSVGDVYDASTITVYENSRGIICMINDQKSQEDNNKTGVLITFTFTVNEGFHGDSNGINIIMTENDLVDKNYDLPGVTVSNNLAKTAVHNFVSEPKETKGDCLTDHTMTYTCTECGDIVVVLEEAPGHTVVTDNAVAATCTTEGKTEGAHCSVCNTVLTAQDTVPALGHTEVIDAAVEATCTEAGLTEGKHCSVCNEVLVAQETVAAKGHTEVVDAAVEPTKSETGLTEGKHCSVCNEVLVAQETIEKLASFPWIWVVIIAAVVVIGGVVAFVVISKKKKN